MPIRINLLAEEQALEELRRRDPVKRAIWVGAFLVFLVLLWSSSLQLKSMIAKSQLSHVQGQIASRSNTFSVVMANQAQLQDVTYRLDKLHQLATNRLLNGTLLNALQQTTVDDVQLVRLKVDQHYDVTEPAKSKGGDKKSAPARAATATEHITLTLDARDSGANPGDQITRIKQSIAANAYFAAALGKTNEVRLMNYLPPQVGPEGKPFVLFTLECRFPDKTR